MDNKMESKICNRQRQQRFHLFCIKTSNVRRWGRRACEQRHPCCETEQQKESCEKLYNTADGSPLPC